MEPDYVSRIKNWPAPTSVKELNTWLGFTGYYHSYISQYARLTAGMNSQCKEKTL